MTDLWPRIKFNNNFALFSFAKKLKVIYPNFYMPEDNIYRHYITPMNDLMKH